MQPRLPHDMRRRRIALCHEWITTYGGSERVAARLADILEPESVFTFAGDPELIDSLFGDHRVDIISALGRRPIARRHWQWLLPLMAVTWKRVDLRGFGLVVTSSHSCVNAVRVPTGIPHVSYCHSPMRYAWDWRDELGRFPKAVRPLWPAAASLLRRTDRSWSRNVTRFIANSRNVQARVRRYYGRDSEIVYPPVDTSFWSPADQGIDDYFLLAGRLVAYKRPDVAVRAAALAGFPLRVAGSGPELNRLKRIATSNIEFIDNPPAEDLRNLYRGARALLFPGIEDFGMTMIEAQACGTPVIAYAKGGALEAVTQETGLLYEPGDVGGLIHAVQVFDRTRFKHEALLEHARRFDASRFDKRIREIIDEVMDPQ